MLSQRMGKVRSIDVVNELGMWVEGFGADRRCRVGKNTENVLIIRREKQ